MAGSRYGRVVSSDESTASELAAMARRVIDGNRYMTVGTVDDAGHPCVSPVYFTPVDYRVFYWVSNPETQHSRNLARQAEVRIVIFDSRAQIGEAEAVYLTGTAEQVPDSELAERCAVAFAPRFPGLYAFRPDELRAPASLRLYRAVATEHEVLLRGRDPRNAQGTDQRVPVAFS